MIHLPEVIRQLAGQGEAIRTLAQAFSDEQAQWKPGPDDWSLAEVMAHLAHEERNDFRRHLKEMFGEGPQPRERPAAADHRETLAGFLAERQASVAWLSALAAPDWEATKELRFGPDETYTIGAAEMLWSWVEHDVLHLRQMVELLHGWNERQAAPFSLRYAGGW